MIKKSYLKEIEISQNQKKGGQNNSSDIKKIQSWLTLNAFSNPASGTATSVDGDFGSATDRSVKNYQRSIGVAETGVVTPELFKKLCAPMTKAFTTTIPGNNLRELIVNAAEMHVKAGARELVIKGKSNSGPWVRAYMDGNEGDDWFWCMGFAQTILDQATSQINQKFTNIVERSFSCDVVAIKAKINGNFLSYRNIRNNPSLVEKGDLFLLQSTNNSNDWIHTGIITKIYNNGVFETIEGNTNDDGSRNGYAVVKRTRNFQRSKLDVVKVSTILT